MYIPLAGMVDLQEELERIRKELAETQGHLQRTRDRLANPSFVDRAPAKVVEGARQQLQALEEKERKLSERMKELK